MINYKDQISKTVVLGNGSFPTHVIPVTAMLNADYLVCCDGAINEYARRGYVPNIIIGDGDSISLENKICFNEKIIVIPDQDTNDLTKAVQHLKNNGVTKITIIGATGAREDHTLGNISLLIEYMRLGLEVNMVTDYGIFIPLSGENEILTYKGQQISIFNFGCTQIDGEGFSYPLSAFKNWWEGSLNEALGNVAKIKADGDYLLFLNH